MHLWKYAWDKPALILIILWEPKKEVGRSLSANNTKNLNIVEKHLWQRMMSNYYLSLELGWFKELTPRSGCLQLCQWKNIVYTLVPVSIPLCLLFLHCTSAWKQQCAKSSIEQVQIPANWMETSPEVGKWRNCEVNLCEPPNQNWGKGIESLPLGFPPYALGLAWRLPSGWQPNMLAKQKTKLIPCGAAENVQPKSWDDDRWLSAHSFLGHRCATSHEHTFLVPSACTVAFAYFRDVQALSSFGVPVKIRRAM